MWSSALDTGLDSGLPLTVACVQLGAPSRRERRGPTAQITCIRSISGRALRAVQLMHRCLCAMGRCRPAVPFQRPSRSLPVPRLVRREYSHHLSHGLFDVSASHRAHAKEPSRFVPQANPSPVGRPAAASSRRMASGATTYREDRAGQGGSRGHDSRSVSAMGRRASSRAGKAVSTMVMRRVMRASPASCVVGGAAGREADSA
jgi:hypothetical protein